MMKKNVLEISEVDLGKNSHIRLDVLDTNEDLYYDMARVMFDEIKLNNSLGKKTAFICPVGPVGQYSKLARMVNIYKLDLKDVYIFNMDEYLTDELEYIPEQSPLSFRGFMNKEFYSKIDDGLTVPVDQRIFPQPGKESKICECIQEIGGIDMAFGGVGINGHIAFNEPPENDEYTCDEYKKLGTRILKLSSETRTMNAVTAANGAIDLIPKWCITLGMKEIMSARKVRIYLERIWQNGVVRKMLHGPITKAFPASLLQEHPDVVIVMASYVAKLPICKLK